MKKLILLVLAIALALSALPAFAETASAGIWEKRAYVDEFDLPTDDYYVINKTPFTGTFSNSATTNSELLAYIYVDDYVGYVDNFLGIKLIEYGDYVVKNSTSRDQVYNTVMMDPAGEKHYFDGYMPQGSNQILYPDDAFDLIMDALFANGTVRFAITEAGNETNKYVFTIEDTTGFYNLLAINAIGAVTNGLIFARIGNKCGFLDLNGQWAIPYEWDDAQPFSDGLARVEKNDKYGYINTSGELVISCEWDSAYDFSDGFALVESDSYAGLIDTNGNKVIVPGDWEEVSMYSEGLVKVKKNGKWGFATLDGELVVDCVWDSAVNFSEGRAQVFKDGKGGFIDTKGNVVIPCQYFSTGSFSSGLASVHESSGPECAYIDYYGNIIHPYGKHASNVHYEEGLFYKKGKTPSFYDLKGNTVIEPIYERVNYGEGYFTLLKNGEVIILSRDVIQPGWQEELAAYEAELAEQAEAHVAEAEKAKLLEEYTDKDTVKKVQTALNDAGFPCGMPDGAAGKKTIAALTDYQTAKGLTVTGTITHETLISMGLAE